MSQVVKIDDKTALVLEGGGMRGVFTCGVLDYFMDHNIYFPYTVGVSAGASNGLSYMSHQRGRAKIANIDLLDKYHYIGLKYLFTQRNIMDYKLMFQDFPEHIIPYRYDVYAAHCEGFMQLAIRVSHRLCRWASDARWRHSRLHPF